MKKVKIIKLLKANLLLSDSKPISAETTTNILVPKYFRFLKRYWNYFIIAPYLHENDQYDSLCNDIGLQDFKSTFEKRLIPSGYPMKTILGEELISKTEGYNAIIFDISGYLDSSKNIITRSTEIGRLLDRKKVDDFIIVTRSNDEDFSAVFKSLKGSEILTSMNEDKKRIIIVRENGDMFAIGYNAQIIDRKKAQRFIHERFKMIISDPAYHYYGHYALEKGVHIRIFQDFYNNIANNKEIVFRFFEGYLSEMLRKSIKFDILITFAFPRDPLDAIGEKLQTSLKIPHCSIDGSKSVGDAISSLRKTEGIDEKKKNVLLITDVVYSGRTTTDILTKLKDSGFNVGKIICMTANKEDVLPDERIEPIFKMDLPWWDPNTAGACPICNIFGSSSLIPYEGKVIEKRKEPLDSLNSYDFYDFVKKTKSLDYDRNTFKRNYYFFFFETSRIFHSFGVHISRVLAKQIKGETKEGIDLIVCPVDDNCGAILLSTELSREIGNVPVIPINREDIDSWKKYKKSDFGQYEEISGKNILIVDDGINTGTTKNNLERLCTAIGAKKIVGVSVFLNRLSPEIIEHMKFEKEPVWSFYHWPCPPIKLDTISI